MERATTSPIQLDVGTVAKCARCETVIQSLHRHDFHACHCGKITVDGGKDYCKISGDRADFEYVLHNGQDFFAPIDAAQQPAEKEIPPSSVDEAIQRIVAMLAAR